MQETWNPQATLSDIFISYSKSDRAKAQMLAKALQREGWSVWWDARIPPGQSLDEVIDRALEAARCVIVMWSKKSVSSRWVKAEASEGTGARFWYQFSSKMMPGFLSNFATSTLRDSRTGREKGQAIWNLMS